MYATAKYQGLRIDSYIDERRDPVRSTEAACNTSVDCTPCTTIGTRVGRVQCRSRQREPRDSPQRGKRNFWEIRFFLPRETRNYVPAFMAVAYLMEFPAEHNIFPRDVAPPFAFLDTVMVDEGCAGQMPRCWTSMNRRSRG